MHNTVIDRRRLGWSNEEVDGRTAAALARSLYGSWYPFCRQKPETHLGESESGPPLMLCDSVVSQAKSRRRRSGTEKKSPVKAIAAHAPFGISHRRFTSHREHI